MIRKAKIADCKEIHKLVNYWAKQGKVLDRSLNYVYEHIRDFWIYQEGKKIIGCCALGVVGWESLGEIKCLVMAKGFQGRQIGSKLVQKCIEEAKALEIKNIFALTYSPAFFKKLGFKNINRKKLPHKIWRECINCSEFPECTENAVILKIKRRI